MKKSLALLVLISLLCIPSSVHGQDVAGRDIDTDLGHSTLIWGSLYGAQEAGTDNFDIQSMLGSTRKAHFRLNELFSLEFDFDGLPGFSEEDEDILTNMVVTKFSPHLDSRIFRPYASFGFGVMHVHENPVSDLETDTCAMIGLGARLFVTESISFGIEGDHVWGFDVLHDMEYSNIALGVAYHF